MRHVELEETWALSIGGADILDGLRASSAQTIRQVQFLCNLCNGKLSQRVVDLVDADRRKSNRGAGLVAPDLPAGVALVGVD